MDFLQKGEETEDDEDDEFDIFDIYEDSPDLEIPYDLIAELEERDKMAEASKVPSAGEISAAVIKGAVSNWRLHENDSGSAQVQIVIANERIKYLTKHLLANKGDKSARRGLDALVTQRRKFLNYLFKTNKPKAEELISSLGIRFRPPGQLWDKESKYRAFKNTRSSVKKIGRVRV